MIKIRKLSLGDSGQYRKIRLVSLKEHPESFGATYEEQRLLPKLMFEKALERPVDDRFVVGAFDQEELIGICGYLPFVPNEVLDLSRAGIIIQMYVRSTYSGRKIGLNLTQATIREAFRAPDINQIVLGVRTGNIPAIRVYEQAGFQPYHSEGDGGETDNIGFQIMTIHRDN